LLLSVLTIAGFMSPWLLLVLTFALSAGDAFETPTWRAILPELVPKDDLAPASALNGIEFNLARAVGPALAGVVIAAAGVAAAFVANFVSFCVVMFFSSALFALLPTVARSVHDTAIGYGLLLGCFGAGAIAGALIMQMAR